MSAAQKEQIYVELRKYHLDEFPESFSNASMNELLAEYRILEDEVITMLLSLVNGKSEYSDLSRSLKNFSDKATILPEGDKTEAKHRKHFADKTEQLGRILQIAKQASFKVRPPRKTRESTRTVVTKITKK